MVRGGPFCGWLSFIALLLNLDLRFHTLSPLTEINGRTAGPGVPAARLLGPWCNWKAFLALIIKPRSDDGIINSFCAAMNLVLILCHVTITLFMYVI